MFAISEILFPRKPVNKVSPDVAVDVVLKLAVPFQLESNFKPRGDQGQAIAKLLKSVEAGNRHQTLLGVTGSG